MDVVSLLCKSLAYVHTLRQPVQIAGTSDEKYRLGMSFKALIEQVGLYNITKSSNRDFGLQSFQLLLGKSFWSIQNPQPTVLKCPDEELSSPDCVSKHC